MNIERDKETENAAPQSRVGIGPGERLQAARIKQGLSLEDVANRMHLSSSILEAIEENNFDEITAPIFVKGYLRAYARIVSLSEDEMIQQYVDFYSEEDPPISSTSNMVPELSVADARIKWTTYLVVLVLGVLLAAWWWNKQQNEAPSISLEAQTPADEVIVSREAAASESNIEAGSEIGMAGGTLDEAPPVKVTAAAEPTDINAEAEAEAETQPVSETADPASAAPAASGALPQALEAQPEGAEAEASAGSTEQAPAAVGGTRELPTRVAASGSDRLQIIVHADTWADVKDVNNHQLVYDLLRAGSRVELTGEAPFAVFLGNGHGVELLINDEEFGITSKIRNDNTARLSIGG